MAIYIIKARPGPNTSERILELLREHPEGMTTKEISQVLNRPVSMVNICLRSLAESEQVKVRPNQSKIIYLLKSECQKPNI